MQWVIKPTLYISYVNTQIQPKLGMTKRHKRSRNIVYSYLDLSLSAHVDP
jgi:hypothetical protein